nr:tyrosine-protein phosphatase [Thermaurantiacus tibetensis]
MREGDALSVSWSGPARVDIFRLDRPDARPTRASRVARGATGGRATVPAPASPRPYLLLRAADGRSFVVAERLLPLESGQNFRDLGGYPAAEGRQVAWGLLYRSGDPSTLSAADLAYLGRLGISTVCDLRATAERAAAPSRLAEGRDTLPRDDAPEMPDFGALFAGGPPTAEAARAVFAGFYRELPFRFAQDDRRMFRARRRAGAPRLQLLGRQGPHRGCRRAPPPCAGGEPRDGDRRLSPLRPLLPAEAASRRRGFRPR